jgi:hypothetical protein
MPEQTYKSPNYYEREIDLSAPAEASPAGTPAGVIGTSKKGPAFVPTTVGSLDQYVGVFGNVDPKMYGTYAATEYLKNRPSLTYCRVLGAGANSSTGEIEKTLRTGQVKNAGFVVTGTSVGSGDNRHKGAVQFIAASHTFSANEAAGMPMFTDNTSWGPTTGSIIRAMVLMPSGARLMVLGGAEAMPAGLNTAVDDYAAMSSGLFKLVISSSLGSSWSNADGRAGVKVFSASLNPGSKNYIGKLLNRDPDKFVEEQHLLWADYAVDDEVASADAVAVLSGSASTSTTSGDTTMIFRDAYGHFDVRYSTPSTTMFISQPFGGTEYDLFSFEALDDGEYANNLYKITITNLKMSPDESKPYGTFTVLVRSWDDNDANQNVLEQFPNCSLDPSSERFIARLIGDQKSYYNFDSTFDSDRRLITTGNYKNRSKYIRVNVTDAVKRALVPARSLPFGFRGFSSLKTNDALTDDNTTTRLAGTGVGLLANSIVPPLPFRFKVTKGDSPTSPSFPGAAGSLEVVNQNYCWGVKFERNNDPLNPNISSEKNAVVEAYSKFVGIGLLDAVLTGSGVDTQNDNKFTLAKVAFANGAVADLTGSVSDHMKTAAYLRDGVINGSDYRINDGTFGSRITLATLVAQTSSADFNRFSGFAKFSTFLAGGFDGFNTLDRNARRMNDKASSFDTNGGAESSYVSPGLLYNCGGVGKDNNTVNSYIKAVDVMTDPMEVRTNLLVIPGIRESYMTDYALKKTKEYAMALYIMDIPSYDDSGNRLYDDSTSPPDVDKTTSLFDGRVIDNNYGSTYFPDVYAEDTVNKRRVLVPASVAAFAAIGLNDKLSQPWFAPAGFNRTSLDFVKNARTRLSVADRDRLQDVRINPIANLPRTGYVIFGQKTLQLNPSALDRVNVRRLMLEVKRTIIDIATRMVFEQNTQTTRDKFKADATLQLGLIQAQTGIKSFKIIMDSTNNSQVDVEAQRLNGAIIVVPIRAAEYISLDFIITNSGVEFV